MKKQKMPALLSAAVLALNTFAVFPAYVSAAEYSDATISLGSVFSDTVEITDSESWFNFSDSNGGDCPSIFDMANKSDIAAKIEAQTGDTPDESSITVNDITFSYSLTTTGTVNDKNFSVFGGYIDSSWTWHDLEQKDLDVSGSSANADTLWESDKYWQLQFDFGGSGEEGSSVSLEITDVTLDVSYLPLKNMNVTGTGTFEASIDNVPWECGTKSVMADSNEDNDGIYNAWTCLAYYTDYDDLTTIEEFTSKYNKITASFTASDIKTDLRAKVIIQTMEGAFSVGEFSVTEGKNTLTAELTNDLTYGDSDMQAIGVSFFSDTETTFTLSGDNGVIISGTKTLSGNYFNDAELNLASGEYGISNNTACLNASWQGDFPASISIKDFAEQYGSVDLSFMAADISSNYGDIVYKVGFFTDKNTVFLNDEPFTLKEGLNTVKMDLSGKILGDGTANASQFMAHFYVPVEDGEEWSVPEGVAMGETFASFKMTAVPVSVTGTDTLTFLPEADTINAVVGGNAWGNWIEENGIVYDKEEGTMPEDFPASFTELAAKYGTYSAKMTVENLTVADGFKLYGRFFIVEDVGTSGVTRCVGDSFEIKEGENDISVALSQIPAAGNIRSFGISVETDPSDVNGLEIGSTAFSFDYSFAENKPEPVKPQIIEAVAGDGEVTLSWTPTEDADNYAVYQYLDKKWSLSDTTEETTLTVTGLTNGVNYGFAVKAYVYGEWTEVTSADIVYVTPEGAAKPVITKTVPGDGQVAINWTEVTGAENYAVYYKSGSKWTLSGTTTALGRYVKGLTNGVKYGFAVKAFVNGKWTDIASEDIVYATPVGAAKPVITKAEAGDKQVALNWTTVTGASKYAVYSYVNGKWTLVGTRTTTGMYAKNLTNGVKYGFAVKAYVNGAWTSVTSKDIVYATPTAPASEKPVITKAVAGNGQVALNWTSVSGATNYAVFTYVNGAWTLAGTRNATGMYVKDLTNGVNYGFAVKAYVNGAWTTITKSDVVYATPTASKADIIAEDISFIGSSDDAPVIGGTGSLS